MEILYELSRRIWQKKAIIIQDRSLDDTKNVLNCFARYYSY